MQRQTQQNEQLQMRTQQQQNQNMGLSGIYPYCQTYGKCPGQSSSTDNLTALQNSSVFLQQQLLRPYRLKTQTGFRKGFIDIVGITVRQANIRVRGITHRRECGSVVPSNDSRIIR